MADLFSDLLACLDLPVPTSMGSADAGDGAALTVFEGQNQDLSYHRLFGGQLLAQFVRAACLVCPDKAIKSLHVQFPREGRDAEPVRYEVATQQQGRSFATLTILARQSHGVIATASISMHAVEDGPECQTIDAVGAVLPASDAVEIELIPWETRTTADLDARTSEPPELDLWMRTPPVDAELAPALIAYATDLTLIGTALRPFEGISQRDNGTAFTSATTSHTLWFHRPFRSDAWLLLRQHSPLVAHGRCFARGDVRTEDGALVASYAQEGLVRFRS